MLQVWTVCVLLIPLINNAAAECTWLKAGADGLPECGPQINRVNCTSTIVYDLPNCPNQTEYDYETDTLVPSVNSVIVYLSNPTEDPFLEDTTWYIDLRITDGDLVTIPSKVFKMFNLWELTISKNKLRNINLNDFIAMTNLRNLRLVSNNISVLETNEVFHNESKVLELCLNNNLIEALPDNFLKHFTDLQELNLSNNLINSIGTHAFDGVKNLRTLDLSHNKLHEVGNIFANSNLNVLSKLYLNDNFITSLSFTQFLNTEIKELNIGGNQISCETLSDAKKSLMEKFKSVVVDVFKSNTCQKV